jgi:hypothetical protein
VRKVELEDLLGREQVQLDDAGLKEQLAGKVGTRHRRRGFHRLGVVPPDHSASGRSKLVFLEQSEFALYSIEQEFAGRTRVLRVSAMSRTPRAGGVFAEHRPDVVFHAAAYKHVPLMEIRQRLGGGEEQCVRARSTWRGPHLPVVRASSC